MHTTIEQPAPAKWPSSARVLGNEQGHALGLGGWPPFSPSAFLRPNKNRISQLSAKRTRRDTL